MKVALCAAVLLCYIATAVEGHGYLLKPPARGTAWRVGFNTPTDTNDNANFCGGKEKQHGIKNNGKCGVCGEEFSKTDKLLEPGPANKFATGTIVGNYKQGQEIDITIVITAFHEGYFEFRLCENNVPQKGKDASIAVTNECLNKNLLKSANTGETRFVAKMGESTYNVKLPADVTCSACVLQWRYQTGNNWGCENDECATGRGPQEEFVGCSDIAISSSQQPDKASKQETTPEPVYRTSQIIDVTAQKPVKVLKPIKDTAQGPFMQVPQEPTREVAQEPTREVPQEPTREVAQEPTREFPQEPTREVPQEPTREAPQEPTREVPQEPTREAPQEPTREVPLETTTKVLQETTREAPQETTREIPQEPTRKTPQEPIREVPQKPTKTTTQKPIQSTIKKIIEVKQGKKICQGRGPFGAGMTSYCNLNCNHNPPHCPKSYCLCDSVSGSTKTTTQKPIQKTTKKIIKVKPKRQGRKQCRGRGAFGAGMTSYCNLNCNHKPPHCPKSHCICS